MEESVEDGTDWLAQPDEAILQIFAIVGYTIAGIVGLAFLIIILHCIFLGVLAWKAKSVLVHSRSFRGK